MNPISALIATLLDVHRDAGTHSNPELAETLANALTVASWEQLAAVTGATIEQDNDGQLVLYTGCHVEQAEPKIIHAREPTDEDEPQRTRTVLTPEEVDVEIAAIYGLTESKRKQSTLRKLTPEEVEAEAADNGWAEPFQTRQVINKVKILLDILSNL